VWSHAEDGSSHVFKRVWRPVNDGTCHAVETLVESRKVVHEETTMTMMGTNAVAVGLMTKDEIKDRLCQKYIAAQEIRKKEYDDDPPYDCWSNEEEKKLMKKLKLFKYSHGGMFATKHPIDLATHHNVSCINAFPNMQLRSPQGWWVCPSPTKRGSGEGKIMYPSTSRCIAGETAVPIMILARVSKTTYG
jgi:hypothetical protein